MANLVAIAYDDMDQAERAMRSIGDLVKEQSLKLEARQAAPSGAA